MMWVVTDNAEADQYIRHNQQYRPVIVINIIILYVIIWMCIRVRYIVEIWKKNEELLVEKVGFFFSSFFLLSEEWVNIIQYTLFLRDIVLNGDISDYLYQM